MRNAKIPGFRPGKAPKAMVEKLYSDAIKDQLERSLTSRAIEEINAIKDFDLYAVVDIKREEKDGGFELEFAARRLSRSEAPRIARNKGGARARPRRPTRRWTTPSNTTATSAPSTRKSTAKSGRATSSASPIRESLTERPSPKSRRRCRFLPSRNPLGRRPATENSPGVQGVVQGIVGMKKGEKKTLSHEFPKEFPNEKLSLAKRPITKFEIFEVREKKLPELDAEFFKAFEVDSLDAFKNKMRDSIVNEKKSNNEILKRQFAVSS